VCFPDELSVDIREVGDLGAGMRRRLARARESDSSRCSWAECRRSSRAVISLGDEIATTAERDLPKDTYIGATHSPDSRSSGRSYTRTSLVGFSWRVAHLIDIGGASRASARRPFRGQLVGGQTSYARSSSRKGVLQHALGSILENRRDARSTRGGRRARSPLASWRRLAPGVAAPLRSRRVIGAAPRTGSILRSGCCGRRSRKKGQDASTKRGGEVPPPLRPRMHSGRAIQAAMRASMVKIRRVCSDAAIEAQEREI